MRFWVSLSLLLFASLVRADALEELPTSLVPQILKAEGKARYDLFEKLEKGRALVSSEQRRAFDTHLNTAYETHRTKGTATETCKALCDLVDKAKDWIDPNDFRRMKPLLSKGEKIPNPDDEDFLAIGSLTLLFLLKAGPYCAQANTLVESYFKNWNEQVIHPETAPPGRSTSDAEYALHKLQNLGAELEPKTLGDAMEFLVQTSQVKKGFRTNSLYARMFFNLVYKELENWNYHSPEAKELDKSFNANNRQLSSLQEKMDEFSTEEKKRIILYQGDSIFNLFALSGSYLSSPVSQAKATRRIREIAKAAKLNPMFLPYGLSISIKGEAKTNDPARAASGRAGAFYLADFKAEPTDEEKSAAIDKFILSLENFERFAPVLKLIMGVPGTHLGPDGLAPYYYYPALAYSVAGVEMLLQKAKLNDKQKTQLESWREKLKIETLSALQPDGLFQTMGEFAPYGKAASNALGGLALAASASSCPKVNEKVLPSFGIIEPSFLLRPATTSPRPVESQAVKVPLTGSHLK